MTRFSRNKFWLYTTFALCVTVYAGCNAGLPSLKKTPMLDNPSEANTGSSLRAENGLQKTGGWLTSWDLAHRESLRSGKPIMAVFTGSDWCGPCIALKKNVLKTSQFEQWATDNVVLLELDFPKTKNQSPALREQNQELSQKFNVSGYPTVLVIEPNGRVKGKLGHGTNPNRWIRRAASIVGS